MTHYEHLHISDVCLFPHLFFKNFKKPIVYMIKKISALQKIPLDFFDTGMPV